MREIERRSVRRSISFSSFISLISLAVAALACNTLLPPRPPIDWDPSPTALIVESYKTFGMLYEPNAIPAARLWGDGRLVWVSNSSNSGARQVLTATLTPAEMRTLLASIINAGFYGWDEHYSPGEVFDAPSTCLRVHLTADSHSVCETLSGAPRALHTLTGKLGGGAGFTGTSFVPGSGFLSVVSLGPDLPTGAVAEWPARAAGQSLADIARTPGQWLEGEVLALAWDTTNATPLNPIFHDGGNYYQVKLQVPGVTTSEPPEEP